MHFVSHVEKTVERASGDSRISCMPVRFLNSMKGPVLSSLHVVGRHTAVREMARILWLYEQGCNLEAWDMIERLLAPYQENGKTLAPDARLYRYLRIPRTELEWSMWARYAFHQVCEAHFYFDPSARCIRKDYDETVRKADELLIATFVP